MVSRWRLERTLAAWGIAGVNVPTTSALIIGLRVLLAALSARRGSIFTFRFPISSACGHSPKGGLRPTANISKFDTSNGAREAAEQKRCEKLRAQRQLGA